MRAMRLATWNVNGLRARLDLLLLWLRDRKPDLVGLQELKLDDAQFPRAELESAGYHAIVHGQRGWNGVAVLAREPAVATRVGLPGHEAAGARLLGVAIGDLSFTTVYCPNGKTVDHPDYAQKLLWLEALAAHLETTPPGAAAIVCGDFNVVPAALDSWNEAGLRGSIFHTEPERSRLERIRVGGFVDVFRARHPDLQAFTWWDYRAGAFHRKQGLRIDLVLATPAAAARVRAIEIDREFRKKQQGFTPSDHAPVIVDLA
jgi:exodeoxyribonuclease-3